MINPVGIFGPALGPDCSVYVEVVERLLNGKLPEIANLLRVRLGPAARRVPTRTASDWAIRLGALVSPRFATVVPDLGVARQASSAKARAVLGRRPRPIEETILDTAAGLAGLGLLRNTTRTADA
ncbi:hypothetical protein ACIBIZ_47935 [Nonomuraea spiralis]|uniref:hypothetical protein n=1 Tax=Nonomuraea TaxID=83681 RepID=UPI000F781243|nr:hypothetical protein [Nonomuraea sp. WAC 01424]RSM99569.1 hypothetical protein DMB42_42510 [Nonomuraea sp. WAC 01424]